MEASPALVAALLIVVVATASGAPEAGKSSGDDECDGTCNAFVEGRLLCGDGSPPRDARITLQYKERDSDDAVQVDEATVRGDGAFLAGGTVEHSAGVPSELILAAIYTCDGMPANSFTLFFAPAGSYLATGDYTAAGSDERHIWHLGTGQPWLLRKDWPSTIWND